jgi:dolichyl-phosphate beta-glucosyltransferase
VVIPAFNEEHRIEGTLERIRGHLAASGSNHEIIVVDDGSSDGTGEAAGRWLEARRVPGRVIESRPNRGKGYVVRLGMMVAAGQRILFTDADLSTPIEELAKLDRALDEGADIAVGSRGLADSELARRQPWYREGLGRLFNAVVRVAAVPGIKDTQCGFKLFRREAARAILPLATVDRFAFDVEILFIARMLGYRIREVPVRWLHAEGSKVRMLTDGFGMLLDLGRIRWRWVRRAHRPRAAGGDGILPPT